MSTDSVANAITTMDWVTFGIAVISFILSVYNFLENLVKNAKRVSVSVKHLYNGSGYAVMLMEITNHSQLGISITSGKFVNTPQGKIAFGETSRELFRYSSPELRGKPSERTVTFPLYIDPLRSECVLLLTEGDLPGFSNSCRIELGSSRGKISRKIYLPAAHEDFVSLLEHLN